MAIAQALRRRTFSRPARTEDAKHGLAFPPAASPATPREEAHGSTPSLAHATDVSAGTRFRARLQRFNSLVSHPTHLRTASVGTIEAPDAVPGHAAPAGATREAPPIQESRSADGSRPDVPQRTSSLRAACKDAPPPPAQDGTANDKHDIPKHPPAVSRTRRISLAVGAAVRSRTAHRHASLDKSLKDGTDGPRPRQDTPTVPVDAGDGGSLADHNAETKLASTCSPEATEEAADKQPGSKRSAPGVDDAPQLDKEASDPSASQQQQGTVAFPSKSDAASSSSAAGADDVVTVPGPLLQAGSVSEHESAPVDPGAMLVDEPSEIHAAFPAAGETEPAAEPAPETSPYSGGFEAEREDEGAAPRASGSTSGRLGRKSIASKTRTPRHSLMAPMQVDLDSTPATPAVHVASPSVAITANDGAEGVFAAPITAMGAVASAAAAVEKHRSRLPSVASSTDAPYLTPRSSVRRSTSTQPSPSHAEPTSLPVNTEDAPKAAAEQIAAEETFHAPGRAQPEPPQPQQQQLPASAPASTAASDTPTGTPKAPIPKHHKKHTSRFSFFNWTRTPEKEVHTGEVQVGEKSVHYAVHGANAHEMPVLFVGDVRAGAETVPTALQPIVAAEQLTQQVILVSVVGGTLQPQDLETLRAHLAVPAYGVLAAWGRGAGVVTSYAASNPQVVGEVVVYDVDLGRPGANELAAVSILYPDAWRGLKLALCQPSNEAAGLISENEYDTVLRTAADTFAQVPTEETRSALLAAAKAWNVFARVQGHIIDSSDDEVRATLPVNGGQHD